MREIKFRAWDKVANKMYVGLDFKSFSWDYGSVNVLFDDDSFLSSDSDLNDCELMQFTGLKDKNGKEIYDGDIVKMDDGHYEVVWNDQKSRFGFKRGGVERSDFTSQMLKQTKVIGNIYENPELLEKIAR